MKLVERHIIKTSDKRFKDLDKFTHLSKNLYNAGLYAVRQHFFEHGTFLSYVDNCHNFSKENNIDYRALPSKVAQQTLKMVEQNFKSFFSLLKLTNKGEYIKKVNIPRYLNKDGRYLTIFTNQAISKKWLKKGYIKLSGLDVLIKTKQRNVNQVRIVPKGNHIVVEVLYEVQEKLLKEDNGRYASIDLGVNNLATISSNVIKPIVINGKPLKSINQYYNKEKANLQSKLKNNEKTSNRIKSVTFKRNNKINDYLHKSSRYIVNYLVSNNINTLIIGQNKGWKQNINIGRVNNQNFTQIPFSKFIELLSYKCTLEGIRVIITEESYTSKCSFMDNENICRHDVYLGNRVKRGLFRTATNKLINADLNGSLNILRKAIGEFQYSIEVCSTPLVITIKQN